MALFGNLGLARVLAGLLPPWFSSTASQTVNTSSGWFVANNDTKTADTDIDDPQQSASAGTKAYVIDTTGKSYLDLAHLYVGTDPADDVKVRAFGFWQINQDPGAKQPYDESTSYPEATIAGVLGGFWAPLYAPIPSGAHEQTIHTGAAAPDVNNDGSTPNYKLKGGVSYALQGCQRAIVLVSDAAAAPTVGCVIGRVGN